MKTNPQLKQKSSYTNDVSYDREKRLRGQAAGGKFLPFTMGMIGLIFIVA